jgi:hypothetical protein
MLQEPYIYYSEMYTYFILQFFPEANKNLQKCQYNVVK